MRRIFFILVTIFALTLALPQGSSAANSSADPAPSCQSVKPVDTQFRVSTAGDKPWINGAQITEAGLKVGDRIDVNCFAQNGKSTLLGGYIEVRLPSGKKERVSDQPELRGYTLPENGRYSFICQSATINNCGNTDYLSVKKVETVATPNPTPVVSQQPTPSPKATPTVAHQSRCEQLSVVGGNNQTVPAKVTLRARASDNKGSIQRYKYYFGDGKQEETDQPEIQHTYETSGSFVARVDVKDSQGNWRTNSSCETRVTVKSSSVESHKAACSDLFVTAGNNAQAPSTVSFKVTGYDNKGNLKRYKLDFGNGITKESDGQTFEQRYETAGTYTVKAYVLDSSDQWRGGDNTCQKTIYINTKPLTKQPDTGMPTVVSVIGASSGLAGIGLQMAKKRWIR